jgi:hypothetical protein
VGQIQPVGGIGVRPDNSGRDEKFHPFPTTKGIPSLRRCESNFFRHCLQRWSQSGEQDRLYVVAALQDSQRSDHIELTAYDGPIDKSDLNQLRFFKISLTEGKRTWAVYKMRNSDNITSAVIPHDITPGAVMGEAPSRCKRLRSAAKTTRPRCPTTSYILGLLHLTTYAVLPFNRRVHRPTRADRSALCDGRQPASHEAREAPRSSGENGGRHGSTLTEKHCIQCSQSA